MKLIHQKRPSFLLISLSLLVAPVAALAAEAGFVTGKVVDSDQKGVEEVDVSVYAADDAKKAVATAGTDADGKFTLKDVPAGKGYVVKAVKRKSVLHLRAEQKDVAVDAGKETDVGNLELKVQVQK